MTRLVHRRRVGPVAAEPGGPGATVGPIIVRLVAPLTVVGRASALAAVVYLVICAWPYVVDGQPIGDHGASPLSLAMRFAPVFAVLLPAALEGGAPGVARRNRSLLLGVAILAGAQFLGQPIRFLGSMLFEWAAGAAGPDDPMPLAMAVSRVLGLALSVTWVIGWAAAYRGLACTGARPPAPLLWLVVLAATSLSAMSFAVVLVRYGQVDEFLADSGNVPAVVATLATQAGATAVAVALLMGAGRQAVPRPAWRLGAVAALALFGSLGLAVLQNLLAPVGAGGTTDLSLLLASDILSQVIVWPLLVVACALGLGRGSDERFVDAARGGRFIVRGGQRLRPALGASTAT